ncbi:GCC2 and GCC3 family protein [Agrocybe pediades]|nr:GCC2 and GCC3 family protein [Agrocybe pediades]
MFSRFVVAVLAACCLLCPSWAQQTLNHEPTKTSPGVCSPGTYSGNGKKPCTDCPAGKYSKESGVTSCIPARAGYYIPTPRATAETACNSGTYSSTTGATSCDSCPPGYQCPSNNLASPQKCSPGRYSTGGAKECGRCSTGTFNNVQGATGCCDCAAGWFNDQPGNTNCQMCSNQYPYSDPGTGSRNGCSAKPGKWAISPTCTQKSDGTCPGSSPFHVVSAGVKRRVNHAPLCNRMGQKACPVLGYNWRAGHHDHSRTSYECVDIDNDLESCGGCISHGSLGERLEGEGRDCSAIPNVKAVKCRQSRCVIESCRHGFGRSSDGEYCVAEAV